ncbi:hypothetical protein B0I33_104287 [Prauserella shujinwangii]|uniref:Metalloprotease n=1 Tax=Prauserella shujinwangii TaxID=1453103 RepID=A0A2T0LWS2_9PSEU|nr:neutral zinc metallopeptidase [Prauserella shujinwangii]PRX48470.1 hypothetical protein B0I33_104287 [Prauserella shujinwangii]
MDSAGNRPGRPEPTQPLIEDLPLSLLDGEPARPRPRRGRSVRLRLLPLLVAVALGAGVLLVVTATRDGDGGASGGDGLVAAGGGGPAPVFATEGNPVVTMALRLPRVTCELPAIGAGEARLRALYEAEIRCLERAWRPVLREAGVPFGPVAVHLGDDPQTECGDLPPPGQATGFYCGEDRTIYLPHTRAVDAFGLDPAAHIATLAHEYGHHVQELSGILDRAGHDLGGHEPGSAGDRELGRRVELQANCFAGLFLASAAGRGSIDRELAVAATEDFANWVDSDTHGSSATQLRWAKTGFAGPTTAACNTWTAPLGEVT